MADAATADWPGRGLVYLGQAPAPLGLDSMDKVRPESGSAHTPVRPYARAPEPARAESTSWLTPPPPTGRAGDWSIWARRRRRSASIQWIKSGPKVGARTRR